MSAPRLDEDELDLLAAEHALGVLHGADLARARELVLASPAFASSVEGWTRTLGSLADEAAEIDPAPLVWAGIERSLPSVQDEQAIVVQLRRKLRAWRGASIAALAAAAVALWFAVLPPDRAPMIPAQETPMLMATLSSEETGTSVSAAYNSASGTLLVAPAVLEGSAGHEHELWVIPAGGEPVPVGLLRPGTPQRLPVQASIAPHFRGDSTLAISVEPVGGSPSGKPTGPIIATGQLSAI